MRRVPEWLLVYGVPFRGCTQADDYAAVNRERKQERVVAGTAHAALVFKAMFVWGGVSLGWGSAEATDTRVLEA